MCLVDVQKDQCTLLSREVQLRLTLLNPGGKNSLAPMVLRMPNVPSVQELKTGVASFRLAFVQNLRQEQRSRQGPPEQSGHLTFAFLAWPVSGTWAAPSSSDVHLSTGTTRREGFVDVDDELFGDSVCPDGFTEIGQEALLLIVKIRRELLCSFDGFPFYHASELEKQVAP